MPNEPDNTQKLLIEEILADARRKAERTLKRAHSEADKAARAALAEAIEQAETIEQAAAEQGAKLLDRTMAGLPLDLRVYDLKARDAYVQQVFDAVLAEFAAADGPRRREVIARLAVEAVVAIGEGDVHLQLGREDAKWADAAWLAEVARLAGESSGKKLKLHMAAPSSTAADGVTAAGGDGRMRMNNTLSARLARTRGTLRAETAEILFATPLAKDS